MKIRNTLQSALRKTATTLINVEAKLEPTAADDLRELLKVADIPTPILLEAIDLITKRLEEYEENTHA